MLPKLNIPTYELKLVSNDKTIKYRPFLVKEEKILLMALESGDEKDILRAIRQILSNCLLTDLNVEHLPLFDLQYIFLQIRSRSIGETIEVNLKHKNNLNKNGESCDGTQKVKINIDEIKPVKNKENEPNIKLSKEMGIMMKYPTVELLGQVTNSTEMNGMIDDLFEVVIGSIDYIYHNDEIYHANEYKKEEITEFLNNLNSQQFDQIRSFFSTMPTIFVSKKYRCKKCGVEEEVVLSTLEDFFS